MNTKHESPRLFDNPVMEFLSKAHPIFPLCFWAPLALIEFAFGIHIGLSLSTSITLLVTGIFSWTFFEYWLHRCFFHLNLKNETFKRMHYYVHEVHHDHCQDWYRLVAPPLMSITLATIFFIVFDLIIKSPHIWPFFAGFTFGYLGYDYIHFYSHFGHPKHKIGKILRKHHLQHHFAWPNRWYGVSSPLWDYVFGTSVPADAKPVSVKRMNGHQLD